VAAAVAIQTAMESLPGMGTIGGRGLSFAERIPGTSTNNEVQRMTFAVAPTATTTFALNINGQ